MASLTELIIQFGIKIEDQQLNKLKNVAVAFDNIKDAANWMGKTFITGGRGITDFFRNSIGNAKELQKLSKLTGMSTRNIQEWQYAATKAGVAGETVTEGLRDLQKTYRMTDKGVMNLAKTFQKSSAGSRAFLAQMYGINDEFAYFLSMGPEFIRTAREEAEKAGAIITDKDIQEGSKANDTLLSLEKSFNKMGQTVMTKAAPYLEKVFKAIEEFVSSNPEKVLGGVATVLGLMTASSVISGLTSLAVFIKGVAGAFGMLAANAGAAGAAIKGADVAAATAASGGGLKALGAMIGKGGLLVGAAYAGYKGTEGIGEKIADVVNSFDRAKRKLTQGKPLPIPGTKPNEPAIPKGPFAQGTGMQEFKQNIYVQTSDTAVDFVGKMGRNYPEVPVNMVPAGQANVS